MLQFKRYKATLQSDTGKHTLLVMAVDEMTASLVIQKSQGCPASAIIKLVEIKNQKTAHEGHH